MKKILILTTSILLLFSLPAIAGVFSIDSDHAQIGFSARHMMIYNVKGTFNQFKAGFELDESNTLISANAEIETSSIDTKIEKRDNHLRSPDFFDVAKFPKMTFQTTAVKKNGGQSFTLTGDLTIRDVTKTITLEGEILGPIKDPWGNIRAGFQANGKVNRLEFGLKWNKVLESGGVLVGDEITLQLEGEGILNK